MMLNYIDKGSPFCWGLEEQPAEPGWGGEFNSLAKEVRVPLGIAILGGDSLIKHTAGPQSGGFMV